MKANTEIIQKIEPYETDLVVGYRIITDKQIVEFTIEKNEGSSGILIVPERNFIRAAVNRISKGERPFVPLQSVAAILDYNGLASMVDFDTSSGTMQLVAYNQHDGSNLKTVSLKSMKLKFKEQI